MVSPATSEKGVAKVRKRKTETVSHPIYMGSFTDQVAASLKRPAAHGAKRSCRRALAYVWHIGPPLCPPAAEDRDRKILGNNVLTSGRPRLVMPNFNR